MNAISKEQPSKKINAVGFLTRFGILIIFVIIVIVFYLINPVFLTFDNFSNLLYSTAAAGIAVIGVSMVLISGGLDLSMSSMMFGAGCVVTLAGNAGIPVPVVLLFALLTGTVMGSVNGFFIAKMKMTPLLVTLATLALYRGLMLFTINEGYLPMKYDIYTTIIVKTRFLGLSISVYLFVILTIVFQIILSRTKYGWHLFAIGNNLEASKKIGINTQLMQFSVYALNGLLSGLAGFILVSMIGEISPTFAQGSEFVMITAAVLGGVALTGGKGTIFPGAFLGALMMYTIENGLNICSANPYAYAIVRGCIIFVAVALDSVKKKGKLG